MRLEFLRQEFLRRHRACRRMIRNLLGRCVLHITSYDSVDGNKNFACYAIVKYKFSGYTRYLRLAIPTSHPCNPTSCTYDCEQCPNIAVLLESFCRLHRGALLAYPLPPLPPRRLPLSHIPSLLVADRCHPQEPLLRACAGRRAPCIRYGDRAFRVLRCCADQCTQRTLW